MFEKNKSMFDGSQMRASHILIAADAASPNQPPLQLAALRKQIEAEVASGLAALPPSADNFAREQERMRLTNKAFAAAAAKVSICPSKEKGGDLGWFPRRGHGGTVRAGCFRAQAVSNERAGRHAVWLSPDLGSRFQARQGREVRGR